MGGGGLSKILLDPSYVRGPTRTRAVDKKNFFCRFCLFYIKMKLLQGFSTPKEIFMKNQLTLLYRVRQLFFENLAMAKVCWKIHVLDGK
jgi:hypothetical protein